MVWVEPSFHDVVSVGMGADRVALVRQDPDDASSPLVPVIQKGSFCQFLATLLLARESRRAVDAVVPFDLRPEQYGDRVGHGFGHQVYRWTNGNDSFDIAAALDAPPGKRHLPDLGGALAETAHMYVVFGEGRPCILGLRHTSGVCLPAQAKSVPGAYAVAEETKELAARIYTRAIEEVEANAAIDVGLTTTILNSMAVARAERLAFAQAMRPGRGYV